MSGFWIGVLCMQLINCGGVAWEGRRNPGVLSAAFARDVAEELEKGRAWGVGNWMARVEALVR